LSTLEVLPVGPYPMFAQDSIVEGFFISGRFITTRTMPGVSVAFDDFISRISTQIKFFHLPSAFQKPSSHITINTVHYDASGRIAKNVASASGMQLSPGLSKKRIFHFK